MEILTLKLLEYADAGDWERYSMLSEKQCSCVGSHINPGRVFHDGWPEDSPTFSSDVNKFSTSVKGKSAVISYLRKRGENLYEESRVWVLGNDGKWTQRHYHRSLAS